MYICFWFLEVVDMKKLKLLSLCVLSLSMLLLVGCSDKSLMDSEDLVEKYSKMLPAVEYVSMSHKDDNSDEFGENRYQFKNNEFSFEVRNYMTQDSVFGFNTNQYKDDYIYRLIECRLDNIKAIADKYGIVLLTDSINRDNSVDTELDAFMWDVYRSAEEIYALLDGNKTKSVISLEISHIDGYNDNFNAKIYLGDYTQIDNIYGFLNELLDFIDGYLPKTQFEELSNYFYYRIYGYRNLENSESNNPFFDLYYRSFNVLNGSNPIPESESLWLKHKLAYEVRLGHLVDNAVGYEKSLEFSPIYINRLNVDGELFECPSSFLFVLNVEDGQYYSKIYSGDNASTYIDNKPQVPEGEQKQREFLEMVYGDVKYTTTDKGASRSYRINGLTYKILETNVGKKFEFYRNGKDLKITSHNEIPYYTNNTICKFISLNDFCKVFGLQLERIDNHDGVIYFSKLYK